MDISLIKRHSPAISLGLIVLLLSSILNAAPVKLSDLFKKTSPAVVVLHTFERVPNRNSATKERMTSVEGLGSGVLIDNEGLILTAAHVVHVADSVHVEFSNGKKVLGKVIASEITADVALVKVDEIPSGIQPAVLGDSNYNNVGDDIFVIGAPYGINHTLTVGYISGRREPLDKSMFSDVEFFQTDAAINQGNSGGPMFNMSGEVIGIVSHILSKSGGFEGMGFAVTSNSAKNLLLEQKRVWSGVDGVILDEELAGILQLPQESGALVQRVAEGSMAHKAGLKGGDVKALIGNRKLILGGDIILNVENVPVEGPESIKLIKKTIALKDSGENIRITALRKGKLIKLTGKMP